MEQSSACTAHCSDIFSDKGAVSIDDTGWRIAQWSMCFIGWVLVGVSCKTSWVQQLRWRLRCSQLSVFLP
jgi:hypothetical protein